MIWLSVNDLLEYKTELHHFIPTLYQPWGSAALPFAPTLSGAEHTDPLMNGFQPGIHSSMDKHYLRALEGHSWAYLSSSLFHYLRRKNRYPEEICQYPDVILNVTIKVR